MWKCILFNGVASAILPNNYYCFCSSPQQVNTAKSTPNPVQCPMTWGVCDAFSGAGAHRQRGDSCRDCTQISIRDWAPTLAWEDPRFSLQGSWWGRVWC